VEGSIESPLERSIGVAARIETRSTRNSSATLVIYSRYRQVWQNANRPLRTRAVVCETYCHWQKRLDVSSAVPAAWGPNAPEARFKPKRSRRRKVRLVRPSFDARPKSNYCHGTQLVCQQLAP
jgi:hypothetical protein